MLLCVLFKFNLENSISHRGLRRSNSQPFKEKELIARAMLNWQSPLLAWHKKKASKLRKKMYSIKDLTKKSWFEILSNSCFNNFFIIINSFLVGDSKGSWDITPLNSLSCMEIIKVLGIFSNMLLYMKILSNVLNMRSYSLL